MVELTTAVDERISLLSERQQQGLDARNGVWKEER